MKFFFLIFFLFFLNFADAQPNREELRLLDEAAFNLSFTFKYKDQTGVTVAFNRKDKIDYLSISGEKSCRRNNMTYEIPVADRYVYDQFLEYLQNMNIANHQPSSLDAAANLSVEAFISIPRTWVMNAFVFQYHQDKMNDEKQILEFIVDILKDNATDYCSQDLAEMLSVYVNGK